MKDTNIARLMASLGLDGEAAVTARSILEANRLTHSGKQRIAVSKLPRIDTLLSERLVKTCHLPTCQKVGARIQQSEERIHVRVTKQHCDICNGSDNRRAVEEMVMAMRRADVRNLLVLGGAPNPKVELETLFPTGFEVRFVQDEHHTAKAADANIRWADIVVIWASTQISHKVTNHYRHLSNATSPPKLTANRRGIAALAQDVTRHLRGRNRPAERLTRMNGRGAGI